MMKILLVVAAVGSVVQAGILDNQVFPSSEQSTSDVAIIKKNLTFVICGRNIPPRDDRSPSDAYVSVYVSQNGEKVKIRDTETIVDNEHPEWDDVFRVDWKNGTGQKLEFVLKDHDPFGSNDEILGDAAIDLDELFSKNQTATVPLDQGGELIIQATQLVQFKLRGRNIPNKDTTNNGESNAVGEEQSDAYVKAYWRKGENGVNHKFATSTVVHNEQNPDWPEIFEFANYVSGTDQYLFFKVRDWDKNSRNDRVGHLLVNADSLMAGGIEQVFTLQNSDGSAALTIVRL